jgi:hypothetical protein
MAAASSPELEIRQHYRGGVSQVFIVLFWIHQAVLGLPSVSFGVDLLTEGKADGIINVVGFLLAWIGGTLVFGLAALMHQKVSYTMPPAFSESVVSNPYRGM